MAILRGSKKLQETEHLKNVYLKPNQTAKERQREKALKEEVNQLRENLEDTATDFPVIRNGRIVFFPRRQATTDIPSNEQHLGENQANNNGTGAIPKKTFLKTRKLSKRNGEGGQNSPLNSQINIQTPEKII